MLGPYGPNQKKQNLVGVESHMWTLGCVGWFWSSFVSTKLPNCSGERWEQPRLFWIMVCRLEVWGVSKSPMFETIRWCSCLETQGFFDENISNKTWIQRFQLPQKLQTWVLSLCASKLIQMATWEWYMVFLSQEASHVNSPMSGWGWWYVSVLGYISKWSCCR